MDDKLDLAVYLTGKLDRRVTAKEVADMLNMSRSRYHARQAAGTITADMIITLARAVGLNPMVALAETGFSSTNELVEGVVELVEGVVELGAVEDNRPPPSPAGTATAVKPDFTRAKRKEDKPRVRSDWRRPV